MDQTVSDQCRVQVRNSSASYPDLAATTTHSSNFFHCEAAAPRRRLAVIATPPARPEINARGSSWDGRFAGAARPSSSMAFGQNMPIDSGQIALERVLAAVGPWRIFLELSTVHRSIRISHVYSVPSPLAGRKILIINQFPYSCRIGHPHKKLLRTANPTPSR